MIIFVNKLIRLKLTWFRLYKTQLDEDIYPIAVATRRVNIPTVRNVVTE